MHTVWAVMRLTRLDSSLLATAAILLPFASRTGDWSLSIQHSLPMLFIAICAFVANDLDDLEIDRVNHPTRPLPQQQLSGQLAAVIFFVSLGAALLSIRSAVEPRQAFWYYGLTILAISYGYVVDWLTVLKPFYVAVASAMPVAIAALSFPTDQTLRALVGALFLQSLGREFCMDIADQAGDRPSALHQVRAKSRAVVAFVVQGAGLGILLSLASSVGRWLCLIGMLAILIFSITLWFGKGKPRVAVMLMKVNLAIGLYFLA